MDSEDEVNSNDFNGQKRLNKPYYLQVFLPKWSKKDPKSATKVVTTFMKSYAFSFDKKVKCSHSGDRLRWLCTGIGQSSNGTKAPCKWQVIGYKRKDDGKKGRGKLNNIPPGAVYLTQVVPDHCQGCDSSAGMAIKGTARMNFPSLQKQFKSADKMHLQIDAALKKKMNRMKNEQSKG